MVMNEEERDVFLSWQGNVTGPHTLKEVRLMLRAGTVHSLYQVQVGEDWCLLRERLTKIDRTRFALAKASKAIPQAIEPLPHSVEPPSEHDHDPENLDIEPTLTSPSNRASAAAKASFLFSLCFFIPIINGFTQILALIFGHQALSQVDDKDEGTYRLAITGLWITYIQIGFLILSIVWLSSTQSSALSHNYLIAHGHMLGIGIIALLGGQVLRKGIQIINHEFLDLRASITATLLPTAISVFGWLVIHGLTANPFPDIQRILFTVILFQGFIFFIQMFFWADFITLSDDEKLGFESAAILSLFYSFTAIFVGVLYLLSLTAFSSF
jgi:Domain of unknown function (DUF4190)